jgi:uncharacterized protein YeaO (DUF488 family)
MISELNIVPFDPGTPPLRESTIIEEKTMPVVVKRVYETPAPADGARVLVDRMWPRGLTKAKAALDEWLRDLAPSDGLRKWFHARPTEWASFRKRYLRELKKPEAHEALEKLYRLAHGRKRLTLLFASKNEEHNNATVLKDLLNGMRKPPTGTGPAGALAGVSAGQSRQAKSMPRN